MPDKPAENQVTITLPPGVTPEQFNKSYASWENQRVATKQRDEATRKALGRLRDAHKPEYDKYYKEEYAKVTAAGVTV